MLYCLLQFPACFVTAGGGIISSPVGGRHRMDGDFHHALLLKSQAQLAHTRRRYITKTKGSAHIPSVVVEIAIAIYFVALFIICAASIHPWGLSLRANKELVLLITLASRSSSPISDFCPTVFRFRSIPGRKSTTTVAISDSLEILFLPL